MTQLKKNTRTIRRDLQNNTRIDADGKNTQKAIKKVQEIENISDEARILGEVPTTIEKTIYDYENPEVKYKVTNLVNNNKAIIVRGDVIETFIGCKNLEARESLRTGAKKVVTNDINGNPMYKIEVL